MSVGVSLSGLEKSIKYIWKWYELHNKLSLRKKTEIKKVLQQQQSFTQVDNQYAYFYGMSENEFEEFFREVDYLVMMDLLASAEAAMKVDYVNRANKRKPKDNITKDFRNLSKQVGTKISLESILEIWKKHEEILKTKIGNFNGIFKLRDWLAHGRYWRPQLPRQYTMYKAADVYDIVYEILEGMNILN